ncbi:MAG: hypothetical protein ACRECA_14165, partial [Pseudolabrys sp.]
MNQSQISLPSPAPERPDNASGKLRRLVTAHPPRLKDSPASQANTPRGQPDFWRWCGPAVVALGLGFTVAWIILVGYGLFSL